MGNFVGGMSGEVPEVVLRGHLKAEKLMVREIIRVRIAFVVRTDKNSCLSCTALTPYAFQFLAKHFQYVPTGVLYAQTHMLI